MAEFFIKHICGGAILFIISIATYMVYCGIGYIYLRLRRK